MLGFNALGRLALGQASDGATTALSASTGSFVLTGGAALYSYDILVGGGEIVAGTFSRRRWRALQDEIAVEREARRRARLRERWELRAAARRRAAARQAGIAAAHALEDAVHAEALRRRQIVGALAAFAGAHDVLVAMRRSDSVRSAAMAAYARSQAELQEEEEAIALLLAA